MAAAEFDEAAKGDQGEGSSPLRPPATHHADSHPHLRCIKNELSPEESDALAQFRSNIHDDESLSPHHRHFADDACLRRYLRARSWNLNKAEQLLRSTLAWRDEYGVDALISDPELLSLEAETGKLYRHGFDKHGRPVLFMCPRNQNTKDYNNQTRLTVFNLEQTVRSMNARGGIEQMLLVIDFRGYSLRNAPPMKQTREVLSILQDHYPERLGDALLLDAGWLFNGAYKVLRPFLPAETVQKVHFVSGAGEEKWTNGFSKFFDDPALVAREYGGGTNFVYDHSVYWSHEVESARARLAAAAAPVRSSD